MKHAFLLLLALTLGVTQSFSQTKGKIIIRKNIDGKETIIEKEYDLEDGQDINDLLREEEFEMEFEFGEDLMSSFFEFDFDDEGFRHFYGEAEESNRPFLGITEEASDNSAGVKVAHVIAESTAEAMGIQEGDVILSFDGSDVYDMEDLRRLITDSKVGEKIKVEVEREGKHKKLKGELKSAPASEFGMNHFPSMPHQNFNFDGQIDLGSLEEMMRQLEEQMKTMEHGFLAPRNHEGDEFEFQFDVPGRYHSSGGSGLRFDQITADDTSQMASDAEIRRSDDLDLQGLRLFPLGGSSLFELQFSVETEGDLILSIYDIEGKIIYYEMLGNFSGEYENVIDLNNRPDGDYFLQIAQDGRTYSRKVIKGSERR